MEIEPIELNINYNSIMYLSNGREPIPNTKINVYLQYQQEIILINIKVFSY